jgi:two-component system response regulator
MENVRNRVHCVTTVADLIAYLNGVAYYHDRKEYPLPGVIVLNLDLPGVDGFDALAWLRASPKFYRIPIVVTSSREKIESLQTAVGLGADGFMFKPLDVTTFRAIAEQLHLPVVFRAGELATETLPNSETFPMLTA